MDERALCTTMNSHLEAAMVEKNRSATGSSEAGLPVCFVRSLSRQSVTQGSQSPSVPVRVAPVAEDKSVRAGWFIQQPTTSS